LCFPGFNTEYAEKNHGGHREVNEEVEIAGGGRLISQWLSVILCVLCVALFGF
jgi:hypothetical protein